MFDILDLLDNTAADPIQMMYGDDITVSDGLIPQRASAQMRDLGYVTEQAIINLGSIWFHLCVLLLRLMAFFIYRFYRYLTKANRRKVPPNPWLVASRRKLIFHDIHAILLEGLIELMLSGYLNYCSPRDLFTKNFRTIERISGLFGYLCLILAFVVLPAFLINLLSKDVHQINKKLFKKEHGGLFKDCKTTDKIVLSNYLVFYIRRFMFCVVAFTIP